MAAIAKALFLRVPRTNSESETLTATALFCAAGLSVSLLLAAYGVDLPGVF
jgi:hypothetical protein